MLKLKKWAFLCAAAAGGVLIGCGGSSHSSSSSSGSNGSTSGSSGRPVSATIQIPNAQASSVYISFLTGQARTSGDLHMNIENAEIHDSSHNIDAVRPTSSPINLNLNQYQIQYATIDVTTAIPNSESFDRFVLNPYSFATEQPDGSVGLNPGDPGYIQPDPFIASNPIPIRLTTFPGRDSLLPVFLDNSMFVSNGGLESYNPDGEFQIINQPTTSDPTTSGKIVAFLSDFVQFNIGTHYWQGGTKNPLPSSANHGFQNAQYNGVATHFYFSGDAYAISDDTIYDPTFPSNQTPPSYILKQTPPSGMSAGDGVLNTNATFEQLTLNPTNPFDGILAQPSPIPPTGSTSTSQPGFPTNTFPGTYDLLQANPTDITGVSKIVSIYGRWRNINGLAILANTSFDVIVFPNSADSFTENSPADVIAFAHTATTYGNVITNLYAGYVFFTPNAGDKPVARLYPLLDFVNGTTGNTFYPPSNNQTGGEIDFDLTKFTDATGTLTSDDRSVRNGTYTFDTATSDPNGLPTGFQNTGTFVVFRN